LFYLIELKDFRLIIHNLLDNAAKYSKDNIKVTVELEKDDKNLVLIVKDQGIGIKKENHDKIFDRFYREDQAHSSKIKGTGIGLAIVKEIIEKYHGKIIVTANLPKGIIFKVELPL
ncbi:sensor histidine kinase, partial [Lactobacillus taiwanensis]|uniref:sensor histidine kinase n=1 Tax=Lactobacillus taiwanensis TaxID=508451 RepID=UPI00248BB586